MMRSSSANYRSSVARSRDVHLDSVDLQSDLDAKSVHHQPAQKVKFCRPCRFIDLDHEHFRLKFDGAHMSRDEVTYDIIPPSKQTTDLMSVGSPQSFKDAVKGLGQRNDAVGHKTTVPGFIVPLVIQEH